MLTKKRDRNVANAIYKLVRTERTEKNVLEAISDPMDIGRTQHSILLYLCQLKTPPTQAELADHFDVSPAAITVSLRKLEKAGMIIRIAQQKNARANQVTLTEAGLAKAKASIMAFNQVNLDMTEGLSDEDIANLDRMLEIMLDNLKKKYPTMLTKRGSEEE